MERHIKRLIALMLCLILTFGFTVPVAAAEALSVPVATDIQTIELLCTTIEVNTLGVQGVKPGDTEDYHSTVEEAAAELRQGLQARTEDIVIALRTDRCDEQLMRDVLNAAFVHTGEPTQGDYLRWQCGRCEINMSGYSSGSTYYLTLTYSPEYYTTAAQEAQLNLEIDVLLAQLDVDDVTDYEKVCAIYDYICSNVTYDEAGLAAEESKLIYTAYAALVNGTAVCQGYANLFYRLALELDVDARFVFGTGNGGDHGWNIVKLNGKYYNLDATWDAARAQANMEYDYFLRCDASFGDHIRDEEYMTAEFQKAYPMDTVDFSPPDEPVAGDFTGDGLATSDDVVQLLLHVSMPDLFPISAEADFTGDGLVTSDDVVQLLLHVSMPDLFPLQFGKQEE